LLVVDASLAIELSLDRIGEQARDALGEDQLIAPALLWSEVPSVISELGYRNEITRELADQAFDRFISGKVGITEERPAGLTRTAWRLARELGWAKTYDAEYIALAQIARCRLVTLDIRLRRGADRLGIVVTPYELL
jgi:predicted nucleic acid-binding protein